MKILWQDVRYVAVYKPAGMLVHRSRIAPRAGAPALQVARDALGGRLYPVHRLDRPVAGVLLFAFDAEAARELTARFGTGRIYKTYIAVVRGHTAESDVIDYPLVEQLDPTTDARARRNKPAQTAVTAYTRLATSELPVPVGRYATARHSLLELRPQTGRKHQIRRHMKHISHPVVGDTTHGDARHNRLFRERFNTTRLMLCATRVSFEHPFTNAPVEITTPVDEELQHVLAQLGWGAVTELHPAALVAALISRHRFSP